MSTRSKRTSVSLISWCLTSLAVGPAVGREEQAATRNPAHTPMTASALIRKPLLNPALTITPDDHRPGRCCAIFRRRPCCDLCSPNASALPACHNPPCRDIAPDAVLSRAPPPRTRETARVALLWAHNYLFFLC